MIFFSVIIQEMEKSNLLVIGGIPDMIDEGLDGFIVSIDDTEAMALHMEYLLSDPQRCEEMGQAGRQKVR